MIALFLKLLVALILQSCVIVGVFVGTAALDTVATKRSAYFVGMVFLFSVACALATILLIFI